MLTCISRVTGLRIAVRYVGLFAAASAVVLSAQSTVAAQDRFGDSGKGVVSKRDDGSSRDKGAASSDAGRGDAGRGDAGRGDPGGGTDSRGDDGAGRGTGRDDHGGADRDGRDRGGR
jgi:hypothetical protein